MKNTYSRPVAFNPKYLVFVGLSLLACQFASAAPVTIVDMTAVSGNTNTRADDISGTTSSGVTFSDAVALLDATLGSGESNLRIYGGTVFGYPDQAAYDAIFLKNTATFRYQNNAPTKTGTLSAKGAWVWNQADFLGGYNTGTLSLGAGSSASASFTTFTSTTAEVRMLINNGGTYYVSNTSFGNSANSTITISDLTQETWATMSTDNNYTLSAFSSVTMDNVKGVGIFFNNTRDNLQAQMNLSDFQFNYVAAAVPEPSTYAALLGLAALGFVAVRRRRQQQA